MISIWLCEDDDSMWDCQKDIIEEMLPGAEVKCFLNAGFAAQETGSPTYILIDVGGLSSLGCNVCSMAVHNVHGLSELHPGAIFIVFSAMTWLAEDTYNELKPEIKTVSYWSNGLIKEVCKIIQNCEKACHHDR